MFGPPESTVNWPGRRREEGGSELLAHIRVIQVLPVADNWMDEDVDSRPTIFKLRLLQEVRERASKYFF